MSNKLVNSNLILYDRATETWWPQKLPVGIANELRGKALVETEVVWTTCDKWKKANAETKVLSENTGVIRDYGTDPFVSYNPEPGGYYASPDPAHSWPVSPVISISVTPIGPFNRSANLD
jgi:hypothetical protein